MSPIRVLVSDPPWSYGDKLPGNGRGAAKHYDCLTLAQLCEFPLPPLADDAWLWLWRTHSHALEARRVMNCWGFEFAGELVWEKLTVNGKRHFGMGRSGLRYSHEVCMLGKRGRPEPLVRNIRSILSAPMPLDAAGKRVHSAKPDEFFELVESHSKGPYCEIFARKRRAGWTQIGNQLDQATSQPEEKP